MKLRGFDITKAQKGWVCECYFAVSTAKQFSAEQHSIKSGSRWLLLAMWKAYREAKHSAKLMAAKPGEREAKGWK